MIPLSRLSFLRAAVRRKPIWKGILFHAIAFTGFRKMLSADAQSASTGWCRTFDF
jgi:hypothetical protein